MIRTKEDLRFYLQADLGAMSLNDKSMILEFLKGNTDTVLIAIYVRCLRYYEYYYNRYLNSRSWFYGIVAIVLKHIFYHKRRKLGIYIEPNCVGPGINILHPGYIWIDHSSLIGANCTILPRVLIGKKKPGLEPPLVFIGDNCYIGTNATILGPVKIGNNVTIAAGAVVLNDIPDNSIVAGIPAKVIKTK
ncbi:MAG: serine acetyltransferase [Prevotella sp.]|nr:serine acetyltransferase [Prevotella sp.]